MKNLTIPNPCKVDWNKMTKAEGGKFCASCEKIVVDFSSMSDKEIKDYFAKITTQKVCGHFYSSQLQQKEEHYLLKLRSRVSASKITPFKYVALLLLGIAILFTGCEDSITTGKPAPNNQQIHNDTDTTDNKTINANTDTINSEHKMPIDTGDAIIVGEMG